MDKQKTIRRAQTIQPFGVGSIIDIDSARQEYLRK